MVVPTWVAVRPNGRNDDAHEFASCVGLASTLSKAEVKRDIARIRKKGQEVSGKLRGSSVTSSGGSASATASSAGVAQASSYEGVKAVRKHFESTADLIAFAASVKSLVEMSGACHSCRNAALRGMIRAARCQ